MDRHLDHVIAAMLFVLAAYLLLTTDDGRRWARALLYGAKEFCIGAAMAVYMLLWAAVFAVSVMVGLVVRLLVAIARAV